MVSATRERGWDVGEVLKLKKRWREVRAAASANELTAIG
jgi:hypothetical protein